MWLTGFHPGVYSESAPERSLFLILGSRPKHICRAVRLREQKRTPHCLLFTRARVGRPGEKADVETRGALLLALRGGRPFVQHPGLLRPRREALLLQVGKHRMFPVPRSLGASTLEPGMVCQDVCGRTGGGDSRVPPGLTQPGHFVAREEASAETTFEVGLPPAPEPTAVRLQTALPSPAPANHRGRQAPEASLPELSFLTYRLEPSSPSLKFG